MHSMKTLGWNRLSYAFFGAFCLLALTIGYFWWPLLQEYLATYDPAYPWYVQFDWLLLGIFTFMTLTLMSYPDLKRDGLIVGVGLVGGLAIEAWGTQTHLWTYYTNERPPLWIIPAWPIASLTIERLVMGLAWILKEAEGGRWKTEREALPRLPSSVFRLLYWPVFIGFVALMVWFVWPTIDKSLTGVALAVTAAITLTPTDYRRAVLTFAAGTGLGYFLELWGTTRACWMYYTGETPPVFAVLAHGLAAVAFWRAALLVKWAAAYPRRTTEDGRQKPEDGKRMASATILRLPSSGFRRPSVPPPPYNSQELE